MKVVVLIDKLGAAQVFTHIANDKAKLRAGWLGVLGGRRNSAVLFNHDPAHAWQAQRRDKHLLVPNHDALLRLRREQPPARSQHQPPGDNQPPSPFAYYHDAVAASVGFFRDTTGCRNTSAGGIEKSSLSP